MPQCWAVYGPAPVPNRLGSDSRAGLAVTQPGWAHCSGWQAPPPSRLGCSNLFTLCWNAAPSAIKPGPSSTPPQVRSSCFLAGSLSLEKTPFRLKHPSLLANFWPSPWLLSEISQLLFFPSLHSFPSILWQLRGLSASTEHLLWHKG